MEGDKEAETTTISVEVSDPGVSAAEAKVGGLATWLFLLFLLLVFCSDSWEDIKFSNNGEEVADDNWVGYSELTVGDNARLREGRL